MPVYKIQKGKAVRLNSFAISEAELQGLVEANLEDIFGLRFVAHQVITTDGGRIDTLALDESGAPVVIEYKVVEQDEVIIQALSYLDWAVRNRADVEDIVKGKLGKGVKMEWEQPKVVVIAPSFSRRVKGAIGRLSENIELWTYTKYDTDLLVVEQFGSAASSVKSKKRITEIKYENVTVQHHLEHISKDTAEVFNELKTAIHSLDDAIEEKPTKFYIGYWRNRIFCKVRFRRNKLWVSIYKKGITLSDPLNITKPSPRGEEGSTEYRFFSLSKVGDIPYATELIKQSYRATV